MEEIPVACKYSAGARVCCSASCSRSSSESASCRHISRNSSTQVHPQSLPPLPKGESSPLDRSALLSEQLKSISVIVMLVGTLPARQTSV